MRHRSALIRSVTVAAVLTGMTGTYAAAAEGPAVPPPASASSPAATPAPAEEAASPAPPAQIGSRVSLSASQGATQEHGTADPGERVRLTIPVRHLDGSPAEGTVELYAGSTWLTTLDVVDGVAAYRLRANHAVGTTVFRAEYVPARAEVARSSSAEVEVTVTKGALTLQAWGVPARAGFQAMVQVRAISQYSWPQGTIQIKRGTQVIAQGKVQGEQRGVIALLLPADVTDLTGLTAHYLGSSVVKRGSAEVTTEVPAG